MQPLNSHIDSVALIKARIHDERYQGFDEVRLSRARKSEIGGEI